MPNQIKKSLSSPIPFVAALLILATVWIFLRFYNLNQSYFFFGDAGRDAWAMWQWRYQGKIPYLSPAVSALPINVSPIYFYILYPFFLLTGQSYFYSQIALLVYCWFFITITAWLIYPQKNHRAPFLLLVLLLTLCPEFIIQSRYVWNPSFIIAPLVTAFYLLIIKPPKLLKSAKWPQIFLLFSGGLVALSTSLNMSVIPVSLAFCILALIVTKRKFWWWLGGLVSGMIFFYTPMILFEIKHSFQITHRMTGALLSRAVNGVNEPTLTKLSHLLSMPMSNLKLGVGVAIFMVVFSLYKLVKTRQHSKLKQLGSPLILASLGLLITVTFSLIFPLQIETHYIFGAMFFLLIGLAYLPSPTNYLGALVVAIGWVIFLTNHPIDAKAFRTVTEFDTCMQKIATIIDRPTFVTVQSPSHNHEGYEILFGLSQHGIEVKDIHIEPESTNLMVVMNERITFTNGKDSFYELTQFGPAEVVSEGECGPQWGWTVIERK